MEGVELLQRRRADHHMQVLPGPRRKMLRRLYARTDLIMVLHNVN